MNLKYHISQDPNPNDTLLEFPISTFFGITFPINRIHRFILHFREAEMGKIVF